MQAQILNLMRDLQLELGLTYLFISHDLSVVCHVSDSIGVMYLGRLVEAGSAEAVLRSPQHPYSRMLLESIPSFEKHGRERRVWSGEPPNPISPPSGCHYHPRCPFADKRCSSEVPTPITIDGRRITCHGVQEGRLPPTVQTPDIQ